MMRTGQVEAQFVDVSLLNSYSIALFNLVAEAATFGTDPQPEGKGYRYIAPYTTIETADGWLTLAVGDPSSWDRFAHVIGLDKGLCNRYFADNANRVKNRQMLDDILEKIFKSRSAGEWERILKQNRIPVMAVRTIKQFLEDAQTGARKIYEWIPDTFGGSGQIAIPGNPLNCSNLGMADTTRAPKRGEHTVQIMRGLGFTEDEIQQYSDEGIIA